jgi:glucose 1-dehydrogenase
LVTGAGGIDSIGRGIVTELATEGADVVINDLESRRTDAEGLAADIKKLGVKAFVIIADLSTVDGCKKLIAQSVEALGGLDILVNNAGGGKRAPFEQITEADYDLILNINLKAPFFMCQAAIPHLRANKCGRIINIGSELGYNGLSVNAHYTAAKAGVRNLTKSLAIAFAPDVTVNTVCPGPTDTPRLRGTVEYRQEVLDTIPLRRWGTPKDIGRSVVFLASSDGDAFTGQTLDPNVGMVMD